MARLEHKSNGRSGPYQVWRQVSFEAIADLKCRSLDAGGTFLSCGVSLKTS